jgi:hypothetical protein
MALSGMLPLSAEFVLPAAEFGPAELCSAAPPDVSALPDGGTVASFAASDDTPGPVGSFPESSAASAGARPSNNATAVDAKRRFMGVLHALLSSRKEAKPKLDLAMHVLTPLGRKTSRDCDRSEKHARLSAIAP